MMSRTSVKPSGPPGPTPDSAVRVFRAHSGLGTKGRLYSGNRDSASHHPISNKQRLTLLFADIRGFTGLAEEMDPEDCVRLLNVYFAVAAEAVQGFGGNVDNFQGDGLMATFAASPGDETHERRAVKCAVSLRETIRHLVIPGLPKGRLQVGIGISTGIAAVGYVGSRNRRDFTAIGDVVNVANRLQSISGPDQIVISQETCCHIGDDLPLEPLGLLQLRGRVQPVAAFAVK
ncbi:MAG TPA: adenylate/guanylate cyclase domain-containing protein [Terriglobia bacterium]|nr:adenylate/guanylate cyclase domain-containing protein [Terriglobia bacterium]